MKKAILITGGAGFLGSYLCERSLYSGLKVFFLDNLITGSKRNIENLAVLIKRLTYRLSPSSFILLRFLLLPAAL